MMACTSSTTEIGELKACIDIIRTNEEVHKYDRLKALDILLEKSRLYGIEAEDIDSLLEIVCCGKLSKPASKQLVLCLIPRGSVSYNTILNAISWICTGTLSTTLMSLLLRWIIAVYNEIDSTQSLHCCYEFLFHYLENEKLGPYASHLLALMTVKNDVKIFRVNRLKKLILKLGFSKHLGTLLNIYKTYCPRLVEGIKLSSTDKLSFKDSTKAWSIYIQRLQARPSVQLNPALTVPEWLMEPGEEHEVAKTKNHKNNLEIPSIQTIIFEDEAGLKMPLEEIKSFSELLDNLDKIELPNEMACLLRYKKLMVILTCFKAEEAFLRLDFWLKDFLIDKFLINDGKLLSEEKNRFLHRIADFSDYTEGNLPAVNKFLMQFLYIWNGHDYQDSILRLISHYQLCEFEDLSNLILTSLQRIFPLASYQVKINILKSLIELLFNFAKKYPDINSLDESHSKNPFFVNPTINEFHYLNTMFELLTVIQDMCSVALEMDPNESMIHAVLNIQERIPDLHLIFDLPILLLPPANVLYRCLFSSNAMTVCRICSLMCRFKKCIVSLKTSKPPSSFYASNQQRSTEEINTFNLYLLDISNTLWKNKAFISAPNSLIYNISINVLETLEISSIPEAFSIYNHPALLGHTIYFMEETQNIDRPVSPKFLFSHKPNALDEYLQFLTVSGSWGIQEFISEFIDRTHSRN